MCDSSLPEGTVGRKQVVLLHPLPFFKKRVLGAVFRPAFAPQWRKADGGLRKDEGGMRNVAEKN